MPSGSTGTISRVISPMTKQKVQEKEIQHRAIAVQGPEEVAHTDYGKITKASSDELTVKVVALNGATVADGNKIPLAHSPREIIDRWGSVGALKGAIVKVDYIGLDGKMAIATIIREKGESIQEQLPEVNNIKRGIFKIFSPGSNLS